MKHQFCILYLLILFIGMAACKDKTHFTIIGEVSGQQSMNLYMRYYGNERLNTGVTAVTEGKFKFEGASQQPTVVEIMDNERRVLGRVYIENGERVSVSLDRNNPWVFSATGGNFNAEWSEAVRNNSDPLAAGGSQANEAIEKYIEAHPQDMVSSLLFITLYDYSTEPSRADSIVQNLNPEIRPGYLFDRYATQMNGVNLHVGAYRVDTVAYRPYKRDTVAYFTPAAKASLLGFSNDKSHRTDSIVPKYKELAKKSKLKLLDIMLTPDTSMWKRMTRTDSATWDQGWIPGGVFGMSIDSLSIPCLPYYIVVDTAGVQRYRGASLSAAADTIDAMLAR